MAEIKWNSYSNNTTNNHTDTNKTQVGFFSLKEDKEQAYVRLQVSSMDDVEAYTFHEVTVSNGKKRKINCLRESAKEDLELCPLCAANYPVNTKWYVKMIQFTSDANKNVIKTPRIWEKNYKFACEINQLLGDYNDLTQHIVKITRNGKPRDTNTTYHILPLPQSNPLYQNPNMKNEPELFGDYTIKGRLILNKSAEDMKHFIETGDFPRKDFSGAVAKAPIENTIPTPSATPITSIASVVTPVETFTPVVEDADLPF